MRPWVPHLTYFTHTPTPRSVHVLLCCFIFSRSGASTWRKFLVEQLPWSPWSQSSAWLSQLAYSQQVSLTGLKSCSHFCDFGWRFRCLKWLWAWSEVPGWCSSLREDGGESHGESTSQISFVRGWARGLVGVRSVLVCQQYRSSTGLPAEMCETRLHTDPGMQCWACSLQASDRWFLQEQWSSVP